MDEDEALAGTNLSKTRKDVRHAELEALGGSSRYASKCPECGRGILPVRRDLETLEITRLDVCLLCGQKFRYLDEPMPH